MKRSRTKKNSHQRREEREQPRRNREASPGFGKIFLHEKGPECLASTLIPCPGTSRRVIKLDAKDKPVITTGEDGKKSLVLITVPTDRFFHSRNGSTVYAVCPDGSWRKILEGKPAKNVKASARNRQREANKAIRFQAALGDEKKFESITKRWEVIPDGYPRLFEGEEYQLPKAA